jgi:hypothetical protein
VPRAPPDQLECGISGDLSLNFLPLFMTMGRRVKAKNFTDAGPDPEAAAGTAQSLRARAQSSPFSVVKGMT